MIDSDTNPLYPFTILKDVRSLFGDEIPFSQLDNMVYDAFEGNDCDDPYDPDSSDWNSIHYHIPLSSYIFDPNLIPSNNNSLKLRSFNIRSLTRHLEQFLDNNNCLFDILCVCETRLTENLTKQGQIEPFECFHQCRNRDGGGVSVYVRRAFSPVHVPQLSFTSDCLEAVAAQFSTSKGQRDLVISVYRPPSASVTDFINKMEDVIKFTREKNYQNIYIAGDINVDLLKTSDQDKTDLSNLMHSYNFYCAINKPTRVCDTTATLIDHI